MMIESLPDLNILMGSAYAKGFGGFSQNFEKAKLFFEDCENDPRCLTGLAWLYFNAPYAENLTLFEQNQATFAGTKVVRDEEKGLALLKKAVKG